MCAYENKNKIRIVSKKQTLVIILLSDCYQLPMIEFVPYSLKQPLSDSEMKRTRAVCFYCFVIVHPNL